MKHYKCQISKGIPKIVENMKEPIKPPLDTEISGTQILDKAFVEVIDLILRDYVDVWYKHISSNDNFTYEVRQTMYRILKNVSIRCKNVDWISLLTEDFPNEIGSHIRLYRLSNHHCRRNKDKDQHEEFFYLESETDKLYCRQKISTDQNAEKDYLGSISEFILYIITSSEEFNVPPLRYLLREILVNAILLPTINMLSDPDFINQYIVWMCKDNSYTSEYFIQAIRMSSSTDELKSVIERLDIFSKCLRSRDSGGDDDALIKAQLGSLEFVKKICEARLKKLNDNPNGVNLEKSISSIKLSTITLEFILEHEIGMRLFSEFLTTNNSQNHLTIYLNILYFPTIYRKLSDSSEDVFKSTNSSINAVAMAQQITDTRKILKDLIDLNISPPLLLDLEFKINNEQLNDEMFEDIKKELLDCLKNKYFEAFKKSNYFQQFLDECEYSRDDSLISDEDTLSLNHHSAFDTINSNSVHQYAETDSYTVRIVDAECVKNSYILYTLVIIKTDKYGHKETWKTQRRYRDFDSLNTQIINKYGKISELRLPSKKPFNNMTKEFLEKRSLDLQEYLMACFNLKQLQSYPDLNKIIINFVQKTDYNNQPQINRMQSIVNPFKSMSNAVLSMSDNLVGNITKLHSTISPTKKMNSQDLDFRSKDGEINDSFYFDQNDYSKFGNDNDQTKAESIPIRILFLLVDEIFDLQSKSQMVRKGILGILRRIVKTFFGIKVNKIILEKAGKFTSAGQVAEFLMKFKEYMWPNGKRGPPSNDRDKMTKMRTCVLCRAKMLGSISDEVSQLLGNDTTRQGVQRVFDLCQDQILNRRLVHSILQLILQKLFHGHNLEKLIQYKLCPATCGKVCNEHKLNAPEWRNWGLL